MAKATIEVTEYDLNAELMAKYFGGEVVELGDGTKQWIAPACAADEEPIEFNGKKYRIIRNSVKLNADFRKPTILKITFEQID